MVVKVGLHPYDKAGEVRRVRRKTAPIAVTVEEQKALESLSIL